MTDRVTEVAFAIYMEFIREPDIERALRRFNRVPAATREQFKREACAAIRVADATQEEFA